MNSSTKESMVFIYLSFKKLFFGKIAKSSKWLILGSIISGLFGYIYHISMGRLLSIQEYGLFSAMMALFIIVGAPLSTLMMVISRKVSEYFASNDINSIKGLYLFITFRSILVAMCILLLSFLVAEEIQAFLNAPSSTYAYLIIILLILSGLPFINNAFLQGMQNFTWLSASGILHVLFKVVFSISLVWLGFGVFGAIGGAILATIAVWIITFYPLQRSMMKVKDEKQYLNTFSLKEVLPVLLANTSFGLMSQLDIVLANYFFSREDASLYSAAAILGKAVMYLPGGIVLAMFPLAAESLTRGEQGFHLLLQALSLVILLCGIGSLLYYIFGEYLVFILYGEDYRKAGEILRYYGFAIMPMSLIMVVEYFLIASGRVMFAYIFAFIAPFQILAVYMYHESLIMILTITSFFGFLLLLIGFLMLQNSFKIKSK